ncbi:phage tail protein [Pseudomonas fluorescens]|uniref:phage tail-collar fiber domain-containing protein n=1 Tax=Pseudomonas fluorescens TaxID=294 RepID=UPI00313C3F9F
MADYYTLLTNAGIAYETACKAAGVPIKLAQISVGDGNGAVYNPDASAKALKREVWRGPLNALFQDEKNANWLMAEVTIPSDVGGWYVREAGLWTDTGILYAIVKYPESYKPVLATSGSGKEFYIRSIFETSNASIVTLLIDDTVVKATRAWVMDYLGEQLAKGTYTKAEIEAMIAKASALPVGSMLAFPVDKIPPGFLELDGSVKSAAAYPDLAMFLGGAFNKDDEGAGNFRLPESRGEFLRGWDHGRGIDAGRAIGSYQLDAMQNIVGNVGGVRNDSASITPSGPFTAVSEAGNFTNGGARLTSVAFDASKVVRTASETRPRNMAVMWCIKAWNAPINQGTIDIAALAVLASQATESNQGTAKVATQFQVDLGVDDATIVTPKKLRAGFRVSLGVNGYICFPSWMGGLVWQWGNRVFTSGASSPFAMPFPVEALIAWAVPNSIVGGSPSTVAANVQSLTTNAMILSWTASGTYNFFWFALGR